MLNFYTLKNKLVIGFSLILSAVSLSTCLYYSNYTKSKLEVRAVENTQNNLKYLISNVDKQLLQCQELSDWIYINRSIDKLLIRDYSDSKYNYNLDVSNAMKNIDSRISSSSIGDYVISFVIRGNNSVRLTIGPETDYLDFEEMYQTDWFKRGSSGVVLKWPGIEKNLSKLRETEYFLPIVRPIIFSDSRKWIGWHMIAFSPKLIDDCLKSFELLEGDMIFLLDEKGRCVYSSEKSYITRDMGRDYVFAGMKGSEGYFVSGFSGKKVLVVFKKSGYSNFNIVQMVDYRYIEQQKGEATRMALLIVLLSVTVSILSGIFLSTSMTKPLRRLLAHMDRISGGDFRPDPALEGNDEMGILGKGMNQLSSNVEQLMNRIKEEEKTKSELEYKVLQNQINPHFIYNVLNSIKVMAMIQKSEGIYETATALGTLLKETSKGTRDNIALRDEMLLLDKYIDIQKIRKKGLIQVRYEMEEGIENYKIPRFTLQPIAENAIVHGFEEKKGIGTLEVSAKSDGDDIVIVVKDDGIGIPPDQLEKIMEQKQTRDIKYNNVGLNNINDRIRLIFGSECGISIESKYMEYTLVKIRIRKML